MKTLKIDTGKGQVTLTYHESAQKWEYFSGSQSAFDEIDRICAELGWEYDRKLKNYQANFVAENADKFVVDEIKEKTSDELWSDENAELEIIDNVSAAERNEIEIAFETRNKASWNLPVENYGHGCRNIDEVLTHIRFGQLNDCNPNGFRVLVGNEKMKAQ